MSATLHLLLDLSISLLTKLNSSLDSRSSTNLRTVEGLPHVVSNFSFPFHKRAFPPVYWRKSIRYRRRALSSALWPRGGHLLCFKSFEQCAKSVLNHKARTFDCRPIHQIFQAVPPTRFKIITDHRALEWFRKFKNQDALTARWLDKFAALDYAIEE